MTRAVLPTPRVLGWAAALLSFVHFAPAAHAQEWRIIHKTDAMAGTETLAAVRQIASAGGGSFQVTASCATGMVNFAFEAPGRTRLQWQESETYTGTTFGFSTQLNREVKRWVALRVRVDGQALKALSSSSKYENEAEIVFYDPAEVKRQADLHNPRSTGRQAPGADMQAALQKIMEGTAYGLLPFLLPNIAAGTTAQLIDAAAVKVEIPLADGRTPIVTINPGDPSLRSFLGTCSGVPASVGAAAGPAFNPALRRGMIDGTYADNDATTMILANGRATISHPGHTPVALTYTLAGAKLTLLGPGAQVHEMNVTPDGAIEVPGHPEVGPMRRIQ